MREVQVFSKARASSQFSISDIRSLFAILLTLSLASMSVYADSTTFFKALKIEDMKTAYSLLGHVDDVDKPLDDGRTALMLASKFGMKGMVRDLISAGADVNARNSNGGTALMYSAIRGDESTVDLLLKQGANVNATAKFGWSALMVAAAKGHGSIVGKLIHSGADVNGRDVYHWTPLMRASYAGYADAVRVLLTDPQTDINAVDENSASALHHAATNEHTDVIKVLIDHCALMSVKDKFGWNPLDRAKATNNSEILEIFNEYRTLQAHCE